MLAGRDEPPASCPCGLGARDTLRLEAAMRLYGNDIDETTTRARGRTSAGSSAGRRTSSSAPTCCARRRPTASTRKLVGFEMLDRAHRAARLRRRTSTAQQVGVVTSGTQTPFLKKAIGMAIVPVEHGRARARRSTIDIRGRAVRAREVVPEPFYKRPKQDALSRADQEPMMYPADLKYTKDHEWMRVDGDAGRGRHHRLRAAAARRRRVRRAARGRAAR